MDWQTIFDILTGLFASLGAGAGAKLLHNNSKLRDRVKALEYQINTNINNTNHQLAELKTHFVNIETKLEMISIALQLQINTNNKNEINITKNNGDE